LTMPNSMLARLVLVHADVYWFVYGCGVDVAELYQPRGTQSHAATVQPLRCDGGQGPALEAECRQAGGQCRGVVADVGASTALTDRAVGH
jgi:hypothetical protein